MKILALETSTLLGGVAVIENGKILAQEQCMRQKSHSEKINNFVENCLRESNLSLTDIDYFATGQGPGSFTGIRVAANAAKTYAYSFDKPLVSADSLENLAAQVSDTRRPVLAIINAFKNMVYTGLFDISGGLPTYLLGPTAIPVRELSQHITQECWVVGDGYEAYYKFFPEELSAKLLRPEEPFDYPSASTLGLLAEKKIKLNKTMDWKSFLPLYIRASEAEETKKGILISPLK